MKDNQYKNIIKLLREKGTGFSEKYDEICQKVRQYSKEQPEGVSVKVEGVFEDKDLITSQNTDSVRILTRITIKEGKTETIFTIKNLKESETKRYADLYYNLARIKTKKKSLIFKREEIQDYAISKYYDKYVLTTMNQKNALVGSVLDEQCLTDKELKDITEDVNYINTADIGLA